MRLGEAERGRARQLAAEVAGDLLAQVAEGLDVEGVESLLPLLFDDLEALPAYLPDDALLVLVDPSAPSTGPRRSAELADESQASGSAAEAPPRPSRASPTGPSRTCWKGPAGPAPAGPFDSGPARSGSTPTPSSPTGPTSPASPPTPAT